MPYLQQALNRSRSELVFPNQEGRMMRPDVALEGVMRRALARAGIVKGYTHVCLNTHNNRNTNNVCDGFV